MTPRTALLAGAVLGALLPLAACNAPPRNRGESGYRLDPTHDSPAELGALDLRSQDLVTATDIMAQDIAGRLDITNPANPTRIVLGEIENRTSRYERDYQVFLARLRSLLNGSGARHGIQFIAERDRIEAMRARELGDEAGTYRSAAEYVLACEVYDGPSGGSDYYLLDYQLVQLRPAETGPDVGPAAIVWEKSYEVKYH